MSHNVTTKPIAIEKGVPVILVRRWIDTVSAMDVGDSFTVLCVTEARNAYTCAKRKGYLLCTRKLPDGSYRIWRVK
jgi:hypothetical protein